MRDSAFGNRKLSQVTSTSVRKGVPMTVLKALPLIAAAIILATVATIRPDAVVAQGQSSLQVPADVTVRDDVTPGDVVISWNTVDAANYYRIGWVAYPDYEEIHLNGGRPWDEAFAFVDVENIGQTSRTVRRLTPGTLYAFRVGSKSAKDGASNFGQRTLFTVQSDTTACPAVEPEPQPTPAGGDGSKRSSPIAYGEKFQAGIFDMQITAVDTDAWPEIQAENQFNDPPPSGKQFVLWTLSVWNQRGSVDEPEYVTESGFELVGNRGVEYQTFEDGVSCGVTPNDLSENLYQGGMVTGTVCFAVPTDEIGDGLNLHYEDYQGGNYRDEISVWFDALP